MSFEASVNASPAFARAQVSARAQPGRDAAPGDLDDDAPGLRTRWIQDRLTRGFMRQSRERQPLGLLLMLTMAALCWSSGNHLAVSAWLAVGLLISAMRRRVVGLHARDHQGASAESLHIFLAGAAPVFILEAPFWGASVLLFFARIPEANQLGCWLVLTLVVYGPITRLALVPFLLYWSMNGFFVVMLACVLYGVFLGPVQGSLNYWFVGLTATAAVSTKNRFLAAATHDLRQPVSALALYADFLKDNPETHAELAPKIAKATAAVSHLFDSLFDLSVLDSGKVQLSVEPVQIADVVRDLQLQYEPLAEAKNIRLRVRTGQATIQSDPLRLRRMVGNVLSNAIKYSPPGKKILLAARLQQGDVVVEVFDQGIGIPADQIEKVFEEFYRVNDAATPAADGVGLGLSLVARLAKALKSEVRLDSVAGRGTRCSMRLGNLRGAATHRPGG